MTHNVDILKKLDLIDKIMRKKGITTYSTHSSCGSLYEVYFNKSFKMITALFSFDVDHKLVGIKVAA